MLLYEDDDLVVVNKPAGLLSVPGRSEPDSAERRIAARCSGAVAVHRLDMATSGLLLIAKHKAAERHYRHQFECRRVYKRYLALVHGRPHPEAGSIDFPLMLDWPQRPRQKISWTQGRAAKTFYQTLASDGVLSRLLLTPHTGRSHQLRLHLMALGHAIVGDRLYGHPEDQEAPRLLLHAYALRIAKLGGGALSFIAPPDF